MKITTEGIAGDQILLKFKEETVTGSFSGVWLTPTEAEKVIFELQNFLHEQNNHLDAEQRAQE